MLLLLLRNSDCGRTLRIGELAELLLLLLVLLPRDLIARIALFVLEEQLPRKLLVQLGLRGLKNVPCMRAIEIIQFFGELVVCFLKPGLSAREKRV